MQRYIRSHPKLSQRVMVHIENGYRSSKAAAGTLCYLAELGPYDHRQVQPLDLPKHWKGKPVGGFKYFLCPLTGTIVNRDPPAALSMATLAALYLCGAPRHRIWS